MGVISAEVTKIGASRLLVSVNAFDRHAATADPHNVHVVLVVRNLLEQICGLRERGVPIGRVPRASLGDALNVLCRCRTEVGSVPKPFAKCMLTHLLAGISHLHGMWLVHNDLKPDNLLTGQNTEIT